MRHVHLGSLLVALSIAVPVATPAQAPAQPDSNQMTIHVTVSSRDGEPVQGLTKDDFTVSDNRHPEPVMDLRALSGTQTGVVIILDTINLPYNQVSFARQQLAQFLSSNAHLAQPTRLGVLQNSGLQMQTGFTTDGNVLRSALDRYSIGLRAVTRAAGIYGDEEHLDLSVNMFRGLTRKLPKDGLKRIIWISPGWPLLGGPGVQLNPSHLAPIFTTIVGITTDLRLSHTIVDAINPVGASQDLGLANYYQTFLRAPRSPNDVELGQLGLQVIAQQSGGLVLNSNDVAGLLQSAMEQTKGGYELTFTPAPDEHNNEYHELQVKTRRPGLTVQTTAGYYARPVYPEVSRPAGTAAAN